MYQRLLVLLFWLISLQVTAIEDEVAGCAALDLGKETAEKVALMRAKARWVEYAYGRVISGRETLIINEVHHGVNERQFVQNITRKSDGLVPASLVKIRRMKAIENTMYVCISLTHAL